MDKDKKEVRRIRVKQMLWITFFSFFFGGITWSHAFSIATRGSLPGVLSILLFGVVLIGWFTLVGIPLLARLFKFILDLIGKDNIEGYFDYWYDD